MPIGPVPLVDGSSHVQHHGSLQRHDDVQQQHGDHHLDGADGACCEQVVHTWLLTTCSDELG